MQASRFLDFHDAVTHSQSQVRLTHDMMIFGVDLVMSVTGKDRNNSARVLRRLKDDIFPVTKLIKRYIPGMTGFDTTVLSFPDAIELIMVLPGKTAKSIRRQFVDIIMSYMVNDQRLKDLVPTINKELIESKLSKAKKPSKPPQAPDDSVQVIDFEPFPPLPPPSPPEVIPEVLSYAIVANETEVGTRFERLEKRLAELEEANKVLTSNEAVYQIAYKQMEARLQEKDEKHAQILKMQEEKHARILKIQEENHAQLLKIHEEKHAQLLKAQDEHFNLILLEKDDRYNDMFNTNRDLVNSKDETIGYLHSELESKPKRARAGSNKP